MSNKNQKASSPRKSQILKLAKTGKHTQADIAKELGISTATVCKDIREMKDAGIDVPKGRKGMRTAILPTVQKLPKGNQFEQQIDDQVDSMGGQANSDKAVVLIGGSNALANILKNLRF